MKLDKDVDWRQVVLLETWRSSNEFLSDYSVPAGH